jgi:hypothetical protein
VYIPDFDSKIICFTWVISLQGEQNGPLLCLDQWQ